MIIDLVYRIRESTDVFILSDRCQNDSFSYDHELGDTGYSTKDGIGANLVGRIPFINQTMNFALVQDFIFACLQKFIVRGPL